jgi:hypothetical protein
MIMNLNRLLIFLVVYCLTWDTVPLMAEKPIKKADASSVEARLIAKQTKYILPKAHCGNAYRKRIEEETDSTKLPATPKIDLMLELKNISKEDMMIWPRGSIIYPELTVKGPGVVQPKNLRTLSGNSSGGSIQPTIAPGKSYRLSIKSLNPNAGTSWYY